ncbi:5' end of the coding region for ORF E5 not determined, partial [human papillomavirus 42]|uniref:Probable protein E5 n=1 Tax=Human papillomavirus 42 TaxID=10590 RepID=VE5_HPV42
TVIGLQYCDSTTCGTTGQKLLLLLFIVVGACVVCVWISLQNYPYPVWASCLASYLTLVLLSWLQVLTYFDYFFLCLIILGIPSVLLTLLIHLAIQ